MSKKYVSGSWKKNLKRRELFVQRALGRTIATHKQIAERAGMSEVTVEAINRREGIRSAETNAAIRRMRVERRLQSKRTNLFTEEQKLKIIQQHKAAFWKVVRKMMGKHKSLRWAYHGQFEVLFHEIEQYAFEKLDYYDPKKSSWPEDKKMLFYLMNNARFFCYNAIRRAVRQLRENTGQVESRRKPSAFQLARIPFSARSFLRSLGLNVNTVAIDGFETYKAQILQLAQDPRIGLSRKQIAIVRARLEGKSLEEIGRRFRGKVSRKRVSLQSVNYWQKEIIKKIRAALDNFTP